MVQCVGGEGRWKKKCNLAKKELLNFYVSLFSGKNNLLQKKRSWFEFEPHIITYLPWRTASARLVRDWRQAQLVLTNETEHKLYCGFGNHLEASNKVINLYSVWEADGKKFSWKVECWTINFMNGKVKIPGEGLYKAPSHDRDPQPTHPHDLASP